MKKYLNTCAGIFLMCQFFYVPHANNLQAQIFEDWVAHYGYEPDQGDHAYAMVVDSAGYIYVTGGSESYGSNDDIVTLKYDPEGQLVWEARYDGPSNSNDMPKDIALDNNGNVYITGRTNSSCMNVDMITIKYSAEGNELWVAIYDGAQLYDVAYAIAVDDDGNAYICGENGSDESGSDFTVIKYNSVGNMEWIQRHSTCRTGSDCANDIAIDHSGNVCVTGHGRGMGESGFVLTIKYDRDGNILWAQRYACIYPVGYGHPKELTVDNGDNIIITTTVPSGMNNTDIATLKYTSSGELSWVNWYNYEGSTSEFSAGVAIGDSDNIYVTGYGPSEGNGNDFVTIKYSTYGTQLWVRRFDGEVHETDKAEDIAVDAEGNVYVTGDTDVLESGYDSNWLTLKYNTDGELQWFVQHQTGPNLMDQTSAIAIDYRGDVIVTGTCDLSGIGSYDFDIVTVKYAEPLISPPQSGNTGIPMQSRLLYASPNPFNPSTTIRFTLPQARKVSLIIYDIAGRQVAKLVDGWRSEGIHEVTYDGSNLASGVYLYHLTAGNYTASGKMVLMK